MKKKTQLPPPRPLRNALRRARTGAVLCLLPALFMAAPTGAQPPTVDREVVASAPGARLFSPAAAFTDDGAIVVVWEHSAEGIQARRLGGGAALARPSVLVPNDLPRSTPYEGPATLHRDPVVVPLDDGELLAVWKEERQHVTMDVLSRDSELVGSTIRARRFDRAGNPLGRTVQVSEGGLGLELAPRAVRLASGRVLVVWRAERDGEPAGIYGRLLGGRGMPQGIVFRIDEPGWEQALRPVLAPLLDGGFLVAWQACCDADGAPDVVGRRFGGAGAPQGAAFPLRRESEGEQHWPALAVGGNGELMAAWMGAGDGEEGSDYRIYGQRLAADGRFVGPELALSSSVGRAHGAPALARLPDGYALVWTLWRTHSVDDVYGVALDRAGVPRSGGAKLSSRPVWFQWELALDTDASGRVLVGWRGSDLEGHSAINVWTLAPPP